MLSCSHVPKTRHRSALLVSLAKSTSDLLGGPGKVEFKALVSSRSSLLIHFRPLSRLFAILATVGLENSG